MEKYRFYLPDLLAQSGDAAARVVLPEDQAHHARAVLRLPAASPILLFDGQGAWANALLEGEPGSRLPKHSLAARLEGTVYVDAPPLPALTLATALPKGDRAEWLVEQLSQLNVTTLQCLDSDRGVVKPAAGKIEKWRRLAIESAKQCGRTHVMHVLELVPLEHVLTIAPTHAQKILWLEPREGGQSVTSAIENHRTLPVLALIGPEGGWSEREFALLESAANARQLTRIRLTQTILRIETAAAALAALVMSA